MTASTRISGNVLDRNVYVDGEYLKSNPLWHIDESSFKVNQILRMMQKHCLQPKTICDVGCGAGEVLKLLHDKMGDACLFWGYDISPQALEMCKSRASERLQFTLGDVGHEERVFFDLMAGPGCHRAGRGLFRFLKRNPTKERTEDISYSPRFECAGSTAQERPSETSGNVPAPHYFTKETALETLKDVGYKLLDYFFTPHGIECGEETAQKIAWLPRKICFAIHQDLTVRILGGYSLLVLAK